MILGGVYALSAGIVVAITMEITMVINMEVIMIYVIAMMCLAVGTALPGWRGQPVSSAGGDGKSRRDEYR